MDLFMSRKTLSVVSSVFLGFAFAALATALGASTSLSLSIFVGCLSGGIAVAYMKT